jgi:hypothetical protein
MSARSLAVMALLLAGCGASKPVEGPPASTDAASKRQAAEVAVRYVRAVVDMDWGAACATRTTDEQRRLADASGGTCPRALETLFKDKPAAERYTGVRAGEVRIKGARAGIDMIPRGQTQPRITLGAVQENGEWRLREMPDRELP